MKKESKRYKEKPKSRFKFIRNIFIVLISLFVVLFILKVAPDYVRNDIKDKTNLIINNNNITSSLKNDLIIEDDIIYLSKPDIANFFDPYIYYDSETQMLITTYGTKVASLILNEDEMNVNGSDISISGSLIERNDTIYLPFSQMCDIYNIEINHYIENDIVTADSLSREQIKADVNKNVSVKAKSKVLSRTVAKLQKADKVIVVSVNDGWAKIRTADGKLGYIKENCLTNQITVREEMHEDNVFENKKISLVWDNYYLTAPNRTGTTIDGINVVCPSFFALEWQGKGEITDKVGNSGKNYIKWAKEQGYQVWGMFTNITNKSMIDTTSEIMNDYELRTKMIENIVDLAVTYELDGINIDFEYMYADDVDLFSRFIIELHPRLKEVGMVLSVDVTAPDGAENWSLCFDRNVIADNCDYIVFMAYDQYGESSTTAGTTAGYDWIKVNLNKFLKTEEIEPNKIILGIPFYTRLWTESSSGKATSDVVDMNNVDKVLPSSAQRVWDDDVKQNYAEFKQGTSTYKMWIEDEQSIRAKLSLILDNNLAGAAFWEKGREEDSIWSVISETLEIE